MSNTEPFTAPTSEPAVVTADVMARFIAAFQHKDPAAIADLVGPDCVMEAMQPAPEGQRVEGYEANVAFWRAMAADPSGSFEVEDVVIHDDRATNRWRYRFGETNAQSVRGVTLITVRDGKIVEALGYAKTPPLADLGQAAGPTTADVIRRFNDAFQRHDPAALAELVAPDCVIENTTPAPNGARHVGREECLALWSRIASDESLQFELEDVVVSEERATILWRLRWGEGEQSSVRGVNLMRVRGGLILEARGYVKGA